MGIVAYILLFYANTLESNFCVPTNDFTSELLRRSTDHTPWYTSGIAGLVITPLLRVVQTLAGFHPVFYTSNHIFEPLSIHHALKIFLVLAHTSV